MYTDIGVLLALEFSRSTRTKSSMTLENTSTALAKMAGVSSGASTRRSVCTTAACSAGLCKTEFTGSEKYHRQEKPCHTAWDFPLLNENSTASTIGTSDQIR